MMDAATKAALEESIAHWKRMRDDPDCGEDPGDDHCALCKLFIGSPGWTCGKCPVSNVTGHGCRTDPSPWRAANLAWYLYRRLPSPEGLAAWYSAADAEIAFLEGLRDA